jgi:glycosyltransferase involved in cell wall biosynthesis
MQAQTYRNWQWVIWDDSDDDGRTATLIEALTQYDHRIELVRPIRHSGIIGEVKHKACALSRGQILVELDHDDELTPNALEWVVNAFRKYPEAGFFYTDFAEVDSKLNPLRYPDGWGFGLGSYRKESFRGFELDVVNAPGISPKVIRHIVAAPNHLRAWRRDTYFAIGGHNRLIHVADDYEIMVRTFLATQMVHIPRLGYIQFMDGNENTQRLRNKDIQRHVRYLQNHYEQKIHERFIELGVDDYVRRAGNGHADFSIANPEQVEVASITADL